jgi:hypothetical protein
MPKSMKVKLFMNNSASAIEDQMNAWLDQAGAAVIIRTDTVVTAVTEKAGGATQPCIVVTVWYEPPSA